MKRDQLELIGDAVIDAVKLRLPALVDAALAAKLAAATIQATSNVLREREPALITQAVAATMQAHEARIGEFRRLDETVLANMREELNRLRVEFAAGLEKQYAAALGELLRQATGAATQTHEARVGEFRRLDESVLEKMRAELDRMRTEFDDGLQSHFAEVRREIMNEAAVTISTALMDRREGPQGPPGRDGTLAAAIHWTAGAHIARGTCVQHKGGLWFANVDSAVEPGAACSGYSLMLDGCEPSRIESAEDGYLFMVLTYASGREKRLPMGYRPVQYAGVYDGERDYLPGDLVTCEGSLWSARLAHFGRRPATDNGAAAWQLVVKRGKDGKDGEPGPAGAPGPQGPPGESPPVRKRAGANGSAT